MSYILSTFQLLNALNLNASFILLSGKDGCFISAMKRLFDVSFIVFALINILFWAAEMLLFKQAFVHVGDYILLSVLSINFIWTTVSLLAVKKQMNAYVYFNA